MKKLFVILLLLVLVASLGLAKVKVQFWHAMGGWRIDFLQQQAEKFNATHPGIEVVVQYTGSYRDTLNKLIAAVQAGVAPHVVQIFDVGTQIMVDGGIAVPVGDLIANDPTFDIGKFLPQVLSYYRINGKLYSMPFNSSNAILYYNKTLFKQAGLDPNKPPRTFEEFKEVARQITKAFEGNVVGFGFNLHSWFFEQLMAAQSAPMCDSNNGRTGRPTKAVFNNEAGLKIFTWLNDMYKEGTMIKTKVEDWTGARNLFISQKVAMLMSSTSDVKLMMDASKQNNFEFGTAFLPKPADAPAGGAVIGGASLWIIDGHPDKEIQAAWEFVKWMAEPEQQILWHQNTGYFPVRKDAVEQLLFSGYYKDYPDHLTALMQLLLSEQNYNSRGAIIGAYPEIRSAIEQNLEKMFGGELTPAEALKKAEEAATKAIKEYNEVY
ncbi:ABC transporter substrate-binding protein [Kosmotoga pacifica]|uniref:Glycerol-3-phosphate ABC transporter substrate-binding protein n=1 Tax=Kosmotoga pacifica TaxID=1330330 RepID=A0A0G2Z7F4_9BACT|nr:ABC transporter substrate-binding protein [Kosmotoga pacifica]AKI97525.1 glycerol-3-phosphate ABC transporter substrate-binding protein [Kosmotoga pacifica]